MGWWPDLAEILDKKHGCSVARLLFSVNPDVEKSRLVKYSTKNMMAIRTDNMTPS